MKAGTSSSCIPQRRQYAQTTAYGGGDCELPTVAFPVQRWTKVTNGRRFCTPWRQVLWTLEGHGCRCKTLFAARARPPRPPNSVYRHHGGGERGGATSRDPSQRATFRPRRHRTRRASRLRPPAPGELNSRSAGGRGTRIHPSRNVPARQVGITLLRVGRSDNFGSRPPASRNSH
eukprot:COSAG02_NODE_831_length_16662_cov_25.818270_12_plen_175_part_00